MSRRQHPSSAAAAAPIKLSVNALLVSPLRVRWNAACGLWRYHGSWRVPQIRARLQEELYREMNETMPLVLILALIAAVMIFVVLPASLREQAETILATLWPIWVVQAAPMVCALVLCMLNAPAMALRYVELDAMGDLPDEPALRDRRVAALAVPQILAHGVVCAACACLLVMFSLLVTVLSSVSPLAWLRGIGQAALLGAVCALASVLFAWPGSLRSGSAKDTHRIGILAMIVAALACAGTGLALNWVAGLLGWTPGSL
jgi:hypothetical protein